jgi:hypothetical protein
MNDFSDALKQGEDFKQAQINRDKAINEAMADKVRRGADDARRWAELSIDTVVKDMAAGLEGRGSVKIEDKSYPPKAKRDIYINVTGKTPQKVVFLVHENGQISAYRNDGKAEEFGNVNQVDAVKVREYLKKIVIEIGAS